MIPLLILGGIALFVVAKKPVKKDPMNIAEATPGSTGSWIHAQIGNIWMSDADKAAAQKMIDKLKQTWKGIG